MDDAAKTLLMFSGGRDSSVAALRLARCGSPLVLATVTSSHLVGISRVERRLRELSDKLPAETPWVQVRQPEDLATDTAFYSRTCLPCHHAYVATCGVLARRFKTGRIAFGYVPYQSDWPEQTPAAIESLGRVLGRHGLRLELPVADLQSKTAAEAELIAANMERGSLEQKCLRQVTNVRLDPDMLVRQIRMWEAAIDASLSRINAIPLTIIAERRLEDLR